MGERVRCRWLASRVGPAKTQWYAGVVRAVGTDGRCTVRYDDDDEEEAVLPQFVKRLSTEEAEAADARLALPAGGWQHHFREGGAVGAKEHFDREIKLGRDHQAAVPPLDAWRGVAGGPSFRVERAEPELLTSAAIELELARRTAERLTEAAGAAHGTV